MEPLTSEHQQVKGKLEAAMLRAENVEGDNKNSKVAGENRKNKFSMVQTLPTKFCSMCKS